MFSARNNKQDQEAGEKFAELKMEPGEKLTEYPLRQHQLVQRCLMLKHVTPEDQFLSQW